MVDDCKNFRTRINSYIGEYDADMVINRLTDKKQYLVDFSFEYSVDDDKRLTGLFWADGLCKRNFMEFGVVISFDATFKTNKYKMVFVPFTGIDNHFRNVTLGVGLLASESIDSYKWLLNSFVKSFGRKPKVIVTDQDPAMKQAIEEVFSTSRHRLCMWHIMKKVADKVGHGLCNNDDFKRRMCDIVWTDSIEPEEFERQWKLVANSQLTIVEFMNHFDEAMDVQRFNHKKNDHISRYTEPDDWSKTTLEKDDAKIYTRSIFFDQQTEIYGTITECLPMDTKIEGPQIRIPLKDFKAQGDGLLKRWTKDVVPNELNATFDVKVDDKDEQHKAKQIAREIIHTGEYLVSNLISGLDQLVLVRDEMKQIKEKVDQSRITKLLDPKFDRFSKLIGYQQPVTNAPPIVRVPAGIRNKGRGSHKRIKSKKEQMISRKGKRHKANEVEDDEDEDEFEDHSGGSDDGSEEGEWEEVSDEED
ncbi:protein FAR1-RELATED SEQUENCE 5-like [Helianthus annuus]|uniref:protein FAR1-RELATED SEQUENCE 5-like n=1 Tax=Helianthus annuus TaxID=4232 RepID=UPI000B8FD26F|nr:protein FAR1-RELATED SEQUENCE 5-like [Helianthus annuus]